MNNREAFDQWADDYGLRHEPNYSAHTEADCWAAWQAAIAHLSRAAEPVAFVSVLAGTSMIETRITPASLREWDKLKDDPRVIREGVPVYLHQSADTKDAALPDLSTLQRWFPSKPVNPAQWEMSPDSRGEWVLFKDVQALLSKTDEKSVNVDIAMVEEGLDYFEKAGDAGDKKYVQAIRAYIDSLSPISADAKDAAQFKWICDAFDRMKTSESERFLACLGIDRDVCKPLVDLIDAATSEPPSDE